MSTKYPGGIISKTAPVPAGPFENGAAPGIWTLEQQAAYVKQGIWPTAGNKDPSAFIENLFQTWVYTGNGTTQTINNGIDLAGKGGMVWGKTRDAVVAHTITDTVRGVDKEIFPNLTDAQQTRATGTGSVFAFNSNGFSTSGVNGFINYSGLLEVAWTFREQAKFFDIVTYTGTGSARTVAHNLGSEPGFIIVKRTNSADEWFCYHRSLSANNVIYLNLTNATNSAPNMWNNTAPTSTVFSLGTDSGVNANGGTYVAYLFAHNAGGFGLTGTDNVISCGSYTGNGSATGPVVTLGYEPQWVMVKRTDSTSNWTMFDTMRGMSQTSANLLYANLSSDEGIGTQGWVVPNATGFQLAISQSSVNASGGTYIYIAIRRGPMAVPTTGTSVFSPIAASSGTQTTGFPVDMQILSYRAGTDPLLNHQVIDRLRGVSSTSTADGNYLNTSSNAAQSNAAPFSSILMSNTGFQVGNNYAGASSVFQSFRRAPGFFDAVCFTVSGTVPLAHNLTVAPEMVIYKTRGSADSWWVCVNRTGVGQINGTGAWALTGLGNGLTAIAQVTSTTFSNLNGSLLSPGNTVVAYLFASAPGVSKVGLYTGTGTTQTINCGFTGGARFVMIKRTDDTGDWFVWDTARGMIPANDPYLRLNSTAAEVTGTDFVDTTSVGFEITSTAPAAINANGGTFIFLAIA